MKIVLLIINNIIYFLNCSWIKYNLWYNMILFKISNNIFYSNIVDTKGIKEIGVGNI